MSKRDKSIDAYRVDGRGKWRLKDVDPHDRGRVLARYLAARAELGGAVHDGEREVLGVFADLCELSRNWPGG